MTATVSPTIVANRAAARERSATTRAAIITAKRFAPAIAPTVDSAGRTVRLEPATNDDIRALLIGNRVVDTYDVLEQVGEAAFNNLIANGSLKRDASFNRFRKCNTYWVTEKARELYRLPSRITLSTGIVVDYAK